MSKKPKKITYALIRRLGACSRDALKFRGMFPDGVVPTRALCLKYATKLNWAWAGDHLLSSDFRGGYHLSVNVAAAAYAKIDDAASSIKHKAEDKVTKRWDKAETAWMAATMNTDKQYNAAKLKWETAQEKCDADYDAINRQYDKTLQPASRIYSKAVALAFWKAWKAQEND